MLIDPHLYKPCCQKKEEQGREEEEEEEQEEEDAELEKEGGQTSQDMLVSPLAQPDSPLKAEGEEEEEEEWWLRV